ncbi:MAG: bifunctional precorrin-2 dehydrogenase/sirohydrochlorin ferrochelatase [Spirochaetales bacterium]|nr:bifunctional precorrin-2 dehydrogenase/sirohydrochlorin ferrochelatase [Spirochaetales bacterium]
MYPLFLKLNNKPCLVIGGGDIAHRKTLSLLEAGADITLISPDLTEELYALVKNGSIQYKNRLFKNGDTRKFFLIIAATNSRKANQQIFKEAQKNDRLINCVDDPEYCNFYVPAQIKRGSLKIAISTEGKLPMLAKELKKLLDSRFPDNTGDRLNELAKMRFHILEQAGQDEDKKKQLFSEKLAPLLDALMEDLKL